MSGTCNGENCANGNGAYLLLHPEGSCNWQGPNANNWNGYISCTSGRWHLTIKNPGSDTCATFSAINTGGCPPASGWVLESTNCGVEIIIVVGPGGENYQAAKYYCVDRDVGCNAGCLTGCTQEYACILGAHINGIGVGNCWNGEKIVEVKAGPYESSDCDCEGFCSCPTPTPSPTPAPIPCDECITTDPGEITMVISGVNSRSCYGKDPSVLNGTYANIPWLGSYWKLEVYKPGPGGTYRVVIYVECRETGWFFEASLFMSWWTLNFITDEIDMPCQDHRPFGGADWETGSITCETPPFGPEGSFTVAPA
jgi:hypothetical protein